LENCIRDATTIRYPYNVWKRNSRAPFIIPEISKSTCTNRPRSMFKNSVIKLILRQIEEDISHSKLVIWVENFGFQEKRPSLITICEILSKLKKTCLIFMMKVNNLQSSIIKRWTNLSPFFSHSLFYFLPLILYEIILIFEKMFIYFWRSAFYKEGGSFYKYFYF